MYMQLDFRRKENSAGKKIFEVTLNLPAGSDSKESAHNAAGLG